MTNEATRKSSSDPNNTVIVLGAGLAGLSLALGLSREGYNVQVIEKNFDFTRTGATFGLAPNGRKALDDLYPGIADELVSIGVHMSFNGGTMLGWWNVRDALLSRVRKEHDKITVHTGWLIQELIDNGETSVTAKFLRRNKTDGSDAASVEEWTVEGLALIGADGVNSAVRKFHGLSPAKNTNVAVWRGRVEITPDLESEAAEFLRPYLDIPIAPVGVRMRGLMNYVLFNFHPTIEGTMALCVNHKVDSVDEVPPGTTPAKILEAKAENDKEREEIKALMELTDKDGLSHPVWLKVIELPEEDGSGWGGKGRVALTGDAAHGMRPASGQGGSMAFEDSVVLSRAFKKLRQESNGTPPSKSAVEQALREFENSRLPRLRRLWNDQWERSESVYKGVEMAPWSKEFADWVHNGV